jgi:hypothetical protein
MQSTFVRFACVLSAILSGNTTPTAYHRAVLENDLAALGPLHGIGFAARRLRFESVRVNVPFRYARQLAPYAGEIDLAPIRAYMDAAMPVGPGGELFLALELVADAGERELVWRLPPELVPEGLVSLREDNAQWGPHLEIRMRPPGGP